MDKLRIAVVQKNTKPNNSQYSLKAGLEYFEQGAKMGADIVLFPEMWSNGYAPPFKEAFDEPLKEECEKERQNWLAETWEPDGEEIKAFCCKAKELNTGTVITCLCTGERGKTNTAFFINKQGEIILRYDKVHTCDFSLERLLESGKEFKTVDFCGVKIGIMICYDREFPESARVMMLQGAEIILVPNACDMNPARLSQLRTRSFENMTGIIMANYPGSKWGCSCAYTPMTFDEKGNYTDNEIMMLGEEETIAVAEFDMTEIRKWRERETWGNAYRKVYAYGEIVKNQVKPPFVREKIGRSEKVKVSFGKVPPNEKGYKYSVIISKSGEKYVFCRHKDRSTWEFPGGHIEKGEHPDEAARRELWEETGAKDFDLYQISPYSVTMDGEENFGMLYFADIFTFGELPALEIEEVKLFDDLPENWTYPLIQPKLLKEAQRVMEIMKRDNSEE